MTYLYTGYIEIETTGEEAEYAFESDEVLDPIEQLKHMLELGIIQIIDNPPTLADDEEEE